MKTVEKQKWAKEWWIERKVEQTKCEGKEDTIDQTHACKTRVMCMLQRKVSKGTPPSQITSVNQSERQSSHWLFYLLHLSMRLPPTPVAFSNETVASAASVCISLIIIVPHATKHSVSLPQIGQSATMTYGFHTMVQHLVTGSLTSSSTSG